MARTRTPFCSGAAVLAVLLAAALPACAEDLNDYPTSARADYVFGCMKANGETPELLQSWVTHWHDLVDFEIIPVLSSAEYWARQ